MVSIHDSGGECELLIDLANDIGVPIAQIGQDTKRLLRRHLEPGLEAVNPLDAWGTGHNAVDIFQQCLSALIDDPDAALGAIVSDMRDGHYHHRNLARVARAVAAKTDKPLVFINDYSLVNHRSLSLELTEAGVPVLDGLREALLAIKHLFGYREFLARAHRPLPVGREKSRRSKWRRRLDKVQQLDEVQALALLSDYGIPVVPAQLAVTREQAIQAADEIGYPVVMKTAQSGIDHKSDSGGVILNLANANAVAVAYDELKRRLGPRVLVGRMVSGGIEIGMGIVNDSQFGAYIMVAAGGVLIEILEDTAVAMAPVNKAKAMELIDRLKVSRLLGGVRGRPPANRHALAEAVVACSVLAHELSDVIDEVDINPIIVTPTGCWAVDALVTTRSADPLSSRGEVAQ